MPHDPKKLLHLEHHSCTPSDITKRIGEFSRLTEPCFRFSILPASGTKPAVLSKSGDVPGIHKPDADKGMDAEVVADLAEIT
jgi:hypothetical protein